MSTPIFDPGRLAAIRAGLAELASEVRRRRLPVWAALSAFVAAGALTGGAVSAAAVGISATTAPDDSFTIGSSAGLHGVPALPGTIPGTPIVSLLGGGATLTVSADQALPLTGAPSSATDVRVTVTCVSPGTLTYGLDPGGNNPGGTCGTTDIGTVSSTSYDDFPLSEPNRSLVLSVSGRWVVSYQYLRKVETAWGVNAHGQTYGVEKPKDGSPTLLAVDGVTDSGAVVHGYAFADQLTGPQPTSPSDAATFNDRIKQEYPGGIPVSVYRPDGNTRIGTFYIGAP